MFVKLAWRNIWRNWIRTLITATFIFLAVILSSLMMSIKEGTYDNMIGSSIGAYMGFAQVHKTGYWEDRSVDNSLVLHDTILEAIANEQDIDGYMPRVESFALAVSDLKTSPSLVVGLDTEKEAALLGLDERVSEGAYLEAGEQAALIGDGLAEHLGLAVGDTLILLGQGYHGANAAGKYPIKGIVKYGSPELSNNLAILPLSTAQYLYNLEGMYTNVVLQIERMQDAKGVARRMNADLGAGNEVLFWEDLAPELKSMIDTDRVEGYVFMFILYMIISFGIAGTMLMMLAERQHEFGVLVAVGMKRMKLSLVVWLELMLISILGALTGIVGSYPVCLYLHLNPIRFGEDMSEMVEEYGMEAVLQASVSPAIFMQQGLIVAIIASVLAIYPLYKLNRLNAIESMRS